MGKCCCIILYQYISLYSLALPCPEWFLCTIILLAGFWLGSAKVRSDHRKREKSEYFFSAVSLMKTHISWTVAVSPPGRPFFLGSGCHCLPFTPSALTQPLLPWDSKFLTETCLWALYHLYVLPNPSCSPFFK